MKVFVELDLKNHTVEDYKANRGDWHSTGEPQVISIDRAYLDDIPTDPTDDSFVLLTLVCPVGMEPTPNVTGWSLG